MEDQLVQAVQSGDQEQLSNFLQKKEVSEVFKSLRKILCKEKDSFAAALKAILQSKNEEYQLECFKFAISLIISSELSADLLSEVMGILIVEIDSCSSPALLDIVEILLNYIEENTSLNTKLLELLPKLITAVSARPKVYHEGADMTGSDYKSHLVNSLCSAKWKASQAIQLTAIFREIPLTAEEQKFVIDKVSRALFDSENDDLPGLIYQMLLLSTKETKKQAVEGILTFYFQRDQEVMSSEDSEDSKTESYSAANYRHAQGTVILHISLAAKQDVELGKEFLKILKGKQHSHPFLLSPFNLALSLSLLKIQAFEEQILDSIKKCILKVFQEKEKKSQSNWLRKILSQDLDPRKRILKMLQNSKFGWDHVVHGLVQLGFTLMDAFSKKGRASSKKTSEFSIFSPKTPEEHASALGASLLLETFKLNPGVRCEVLEKILNRVVTKNSTGVYHYIELLSQSIQFAPQQLLSILAKFQHILDYLTFLPYSTAVHILRALTPLLKISPVLRDSLMLVLKKGLFNSAQDSRKISVNGILSILRNFKVASSIEDQELEGYFTMSQVPLDRITGNALKSSFNESLCMELLFFLRRSLAQQVEVRQLLYEGLRQVQERNPQISEYILEFLFEQFNNYYESDENRCPPLKIKDCLRLKLDNYHVLEPLDRLVSSIQYCYITAREEVPTDSEEIFSSNKIVAIMNEISSSFTSLIVRLVSTEIGDFELDKSAEYSTKTSVGSKNLNQALLLMGTCEALLEYALMKEEHHPSPECGEQVLGLFRYFHKLAGLLKEKASGTSKKDEGGGGHRRGAIPPYKHILTLRCLASLASLLFSHPEKELSKILHESKEFVDYVVSALHQKVNYISSIEHTQKTDKTMLHLKVIGKSMLALSSLPSCRRHKQASLDILSSLTTLIMVQYPDSLPDCLASLNDKSNLGLQEALASFITKLQSLVTDCLSTPGDSELHEASTLLALVGRLCGQVDPGSHFLQQVNKWASQLAQTQDIEDSATAKSLLSLCLYLSRQGPDALVFCRDLALDLHSCLGDLDEGTVVDQKNNYSVANSSTATTVCQLIIQTAERMLDDYDWVLASCKPDATSASQLEEHAKTICTALAQLISGTIELVQTALSAGPVVDQLLRHLVHIYNTLTTLTKMYIDMYSQKLAEISSRYENLVKATGTHFTPKVYNLITYLQVAAQENPQRRKAKVDLQVQKNKVLRETKTIPTLIFAIEQYEKHILLLAKKSKINLTSHLKHSTSRDFRIIKDTVLAVLTNQDDQDGEEEEEAPRAPKKRQRSNNTGSTAAKRARRR